MNRRGIREQVFKLLFRAEFNTPDQMEEQARFFFDSGDFKATEADEKTIIEKTRKIMEKIPELDLGEAALCPQPSQGFGKFSVHAIQPPVLRFLS